MTLEHLNKGKIGMRVGALEHLLEVAHRLVRVNEEDELKLRHRSGLTGDLYRIP
jgi:hypothetical protein